MTDDFRRIAKHSFLAFQPQGSSCRRLSGIWKVDSRLRCTSEADTRDPPYQRETTADAKIRFSCFAQLCPSPEPGDHPPSSQPLLGINANTRWPSSVMAVDFHYSV
jgi:hypothetical protein